MQVRYRVRLLLLQLQLSRRPGGQPAEASTRMRGGQATNQASTITSSPPNQSQFHCPQSHVLYAGAEGEHQDLMCGERWHHQPRGCATGVVSCDDGTVHQRSSQGWSGCKQDHCCGRNIHIWSAGQF
ncbi:uncharacterized protein LOC123429368 [Hordeum vulgare subsp. vulgare]|uniref:uncharacterized protein LOC123429368 n=1 Tax=Hordeum vulgare subsp. vulgare TaxID=112509 RepID=UPI00162D3745|nr:uncharacterized protein LOC123429368 [Hordeum vulgare subsp. vulgare]